MKRREFITRSQRGAGRGDDGHLSADQVSY
jgi:hypothetical protein